MCPHMKTHDRKGQVKAATLQKRNVPTLCKSEPCKMAIEKLPFAHGQKGASTLPGRKLVSTGKSRPETPRDLVSNFARIDEPVVAPRYSTPFMNATYLIVGSDDSASRCRQDRATTCRDH